jgi:hypothetical protein
MAPPVKIRLASRAYDGLLPVLRGQIGIPGFDLDMIETEDVPAMFAGMFKGKYDVSEMSLGELIYYTSRERADFVAIPVFPAWVYLLPKGFRHQKSNGVEREENRLSAVGTDGGDLDARHAGG